MLYEKLYLIKLTLFCTSNLCINFFVFMFYQYYITLSDRRYVDLGLQSHRIKCRVHPNFKFVNGKLIICFHFYNMYRLVLIANKDKVYEEFPTPLINRLEKHYLVISKILSTKQEVLVKKIETWVDDYLTVSPMLMLAFYSKLVYALSVAYFVEMLTNLLLKIVLLVISKTHQLPSLLKCVKK